MAETNTLEYWQGRYERAAAKYGTDSPTAKMYEEKIRLIKSGAEQRTIEQNYFSGHGRPVE